MERYAYDIQWDVDEEEGFEKLDEMTVHEAAEALRIFVEAYANMSAEERHDYASDAWHHNKVDLADFVGLPEKVVIPDDLDDDEEIANWLSNEYGYCIYGFKLNTDDEE